MKKIISIILSAAVLVCSFSCLSISVYADESQDKSFFEYLLEEIGAFKSRVSIASYVNENDWSMDDIKLHLKYFYLSEPELFHVNREVGILYSSDFSKVYLEFEYDYSKDETEKMLKSMKKAALKAVEDITDDMTEAEKALVVHDYIIMNCSYDHDEKKYSAYDCLVGNSAVCQGYSLAFMYIMRDILGMECSIVFSDSQNHSWNYLKVGNHWYHVDLTSDDPTFNSYEGKKYDGKGEILHQNLLLSDTAIYNSSGLHRDWDTIGKPDAESQRYDEFFWRGSTSAMYKIDNLWYYTVLDKSSPGVNYESGSSNDIYTKIRTFDFKTRKSTTIKNISSIWSVYRDSDTGKRIDGNSWYMKSYMKLVRVGDYLYFNTSKSVYRLNPETGKMKKVYTISKDNMQIFSIVPRGDSAIRIVYKKDLSYTNKYIKLNIS